MGAKDYIKEKGGKRRNT